MGPLRNTAGLHFDAPILTYPIKGYTKLSGKVNDEGGEREREEKNRQKLKNFTRKCSHSVVGLIFGMGAMVGVLKNYFISLLVIFNIQKCQF